MDLWLFHFFLLDEPEDDNNSPEVDSVLIDLMLLMISNVMDFPMVMGSFVVK